ncbi:hypothetical protein RRF57_006394 [Xylaria bambusicola]|uniref:Uncharacterized protein n=1 Tax=Xylaria bambusicola TaxID=326684 RepID=A0AAN7UZA6_9PEZI
MLVLHRSAGNHFLLSFLVAFFAIYSITVFYLYHACHRDPSSIFWQLEKAHQLSYSEFARRKPESLPSRPNGLSRSSGTMSRRLDSVLVLDLSVDTPSHICERHSVLYSKG